MNKNKYSIAWLIMTLSGIALLVIGAGFSTDLDGFCRTPHHCLQVEVGEVPPSYIGKGNPYTIYCLFLAVFVLMGAMIPAKLEEWYVKN